jgi:adenosylcobyric acid synthase
MNPILLKPESDTCCQVIVQGKVRTKLEAAAYFRSGLPLFEAVRESYERLADRYDTIVIEGAGSAAEMNLRDRDLVNWPVVRLAGAGVLLVADIDRGGVFAQIIGTLDLIDKDERDRVIGILINRFRGDRALFHDGVGFIEKRTGIPVLGVIPFLRELQLDQEDSLPLGMHRAASFDSTRVNIAIVLLPHMSNFTDFNALLNEPDVALQYVSARHELDEADVVIIPGTKNTLADLRYLEDKSFREAIHAHVRRGRELVGICGGYQMLGRRIDDPHIVEAGGGASGFGLLDVATVLRTEKTTVPVEGVSLHIGETSTPRVRGYHIHMGETVSGRDEASFRLTCISGHEPQSAGSRSEYDRCLDGAVSPDGLVWGTYIHGVFDEPEFRRAWLNRLRGRKGLQPLDIAVSLAATTHRARELDRWADHLQQHVTLEPIWAALR